MVHKSWQGNPKSPKLLITRGGNQGVSLRGTYVGVSHRLRWDLLCGPIGIFLDLLDLGLAVVQCESGSPHHSTLWKYDVIIRSVFLYIYLCIQVCVLTNMLYNVYIYVYRQNTNTLVHVHGN